MLQTYLAFTSVLAQESLSLAYTSVTHMSVLNSNYIETGNQVVQTRFPFKRYVFNESKWYTANEVLFNAWDDISC